MTSKKEEEMTVVDSRTRLLESAVELFAAKGFNGVATAEIAKEAEVSEAMLFKHFKSKKGLLHAVLQEIIEFRMPELIYYRLDELSLENNKPANVEEIRQFIKDKFLKLHANVKYFKILIFEMQYHEDIREAYVKNFAPNLVNRMTKVFEMWKSTGIVREDLDSRTAVRSLAGMMNFAILDKNVISRDMDLEKELDKVLDIYFRGVFSETGMAIERRGENL